MCVCAFLVCFGYFRTLGINLQSNTTRKESEAASQRRTKAFQRQREVH